MIKYHKSYSLDEVLHYISLGQMEWPDGPEGEDLAERIEARIKHYQDALMEELTAVGQEIGGYDG